MLAFVFAGGLVAMANLVMYPLIEARLIHASKDTSTSTLRLVSGAVDQAIERFRPIPGLIASDPIFTELLDDPDNQGLVPFINEKLRNLSHTLEVSEIYILGPSGTTLAASNYRDADSFLGKNFAFRPYFKKSIAGETTQFHALGITSGERGYFFSAPILDGIRVSGVMAVKVTVDDFEAAWSETTEDVLVADANGVVFLSNRPDYRLRSLAPLSDGVRARIEETRQFPLGAIEPISLSASVIAADAVEVVVPRADSASSFLATSRPLTLSGWHAIVLTPLQPIHQQAVYTMGVGNLAVLALVLAGLLYFQRRGQLLERQRVEQSQRELLEGMVRRRTADLDRANANLRDEVSERKAAEERLRRTQKDLVQAGKLAALGQMSAAISHEINQPLAAVKSYADNAAQYLERLRLQEAGANIQRISQMADRMAKISGHLRNFARRPGDALSAIPVGEVVTEALALMAPRLRQADCAVSFQEPTPDAWVLGGRLRLEQVLINILSNALDAMKDEPDRRIDITITEEAETVTLTLRDHGPGLAEDALDKAFDAFYSTKEVGSGMGLGLSISFNIIEDFGGKLSTENHPDGGGIFHVVLQRAQTDITSDEPLVAE